jgi:hypothetical protein
MRWIKLDLTYICLTHCSFKSSPSNYISWIDHMYFLYFSLRCRLSSDRRHHTVTPDHASFPLRQDELTASTSSSSNALSRCLPSRAKIEALNSHYHCRLPSSDRPTLTLHYYKKIILTLTTLPTTQPRLHFASSLVRAPRHQSSTHHHHFLSTSSHAHCPSTQWHSWW